VGLEADRAILDVVLERGSHYGLDTDSRIRALANRLTARALFAALEPVAGTRDFSRRVAALLNATEAAGTEYLIVLNTPRGASAGTSATNSGAVEYYLRLVFRNADAAYYLFHVFPDLNAPYILGASRKRAGAVQYLRVELQGAEWLDPFIEACRANPHLVRVVRSTARAFQRAPSNAI